MLNSYLSTTFDNTHLEKNAYLQIFKLNKYFPHFFLYWNEPQIYMLHLCFLTCCKVKDYKIW